jgi:hypothetical protein
VLVRHLAGGFVLGGIFIEDGMLPRNSYCGCVDVLVVVIKEGGRYGMRKKNLTLRLFAAAVRWVGHAC